MGILDIRPDDNSFKLNELKTCEYLANYGLLRQDFPSLDADINAFFQKYRGIKDYTDISLKLHSSFKMKVEKHDHQIIIGANIEGTNSINSYFFAICDKDNRELIRKFHFDYQPPSIRTKQKVPVFHLQYGGKSSPEITELQLSDHKLDKWLSLPRLSYSPMNLALLLDILFCEFRMAETDKIVESPEWRTLILDNEKFLVNNYISNIHSHLTSQKYGNKYLLRDYYYGD